MEYKIDIYAEANSDFLLLDTSLIRYNATVILLFTKLSILITICGDMKKTTAVNLYAIGYRKN